MPCLLRARVLSTVKLGRIWWAYTYCTANFPLGGGSLRTEPLGSQPSPSPTERPQYHGTRRAESILITHTRAGPPGMPTTTLNARHGKINGYSSVSSPGTTTSRALLCPGRAMGRLNWSLLRPIRARTYGRRPLIALLERARPVPCDTRLEPA